MGVKRILQYLTYYPYLKKSVLATLNFEKKHVKGKRIRWYSITVQFNTCMDKKIEHVKRKEVEKASKSTTKFFFFYEGERGKWKRWQQQVLSERERQ